MDGIASYLAKHSTSFKPASELTVENDRPTKASILTAVVLAYDASDIVIGHLGREFTVINTDVLAIEDAPEGTFNYFGRGCTAVITLKQTAKLIQKEIVSVAAFEAGRPFAYLSTD